MPITSNCIQSYSLISLNYLTATAERITLKIRRSFTYESCVEMHSLEYLVSAQYLMLKQDLPEISSLLTLLSSSVDFPANIGPMISSILPLYLSLSILKYSLSSSKHDGVSDLKWCKDKVNEFSFANYGDL